MKEIILNISHNSDITFVRITKGEKNDEFDKDRKRLPQASMEESVFSVYEEIAFIHFPIFSHTIW